MKTHFLPLIILISLELATDPWGVHVDRVEIKDVRLPQQMQVVKETKDHHRLDGHGRTNDLPFYASFKIEMFYSVRWPLRLRRLEMQEPR